MEGEKPAEVAPLGLDGRPGLASYLGDKVDARQRREAGLGKDCTITYHQALEEHSYFTRVHVNGGAAKL